MKNQKTDKKKGVKIYLREGKMRFDAFDYTVHFVETDNFKLAFDHFRLRTRRDLSNHATIAVTWHSDRDNESYIFTSPKERISVIVHECLHAVHHMLNSRGVFMDDDEVFAYHLEYLVKMALLFHKRKD
jgi:hypothetical protein